jgi:hypothetical protein
MKFISQQLILRGAFMTVVGLFAFWLGGFYLFKYSDDFAEIKELMVSNKEMKAFNASPVLSIEPVFGLYRYSFRSNSGIAVFVARVQTEQAIQKVKVEARKQSGKWAIEKVTAT